MSDRDKLVSLIGYLEANGPLDCVEPVRAAIAEIDRLTIECDNYKQVATDHLNHPVNLRDYENVIKAVVFEHERAEALTKAIHLALANSDRTHLGTVRSILADAVNEETR